MPEIINLRPRHHQHQSQLVLPYLPMPRPAKPSSAPTTKTPSPAAPMPLYQHPRYAMLLNLIDQRLIQPNPHLEETFHKLLREFDSLP